MSQSLSDEEFHRMQLQIIEMRTENYKLKDENKKQASKLKDLSERENRLDKELSKQMKMKRALSTLNKSKQAQEYESLLQQTEQEFALQNQTLMQELSKISESVEKLKKENDKLKQEGGSSEVTSDSDLRRLQAENKALRNNIESIQLKHKEELDNQVDTIKLLQSLHSSSSNISQDEEYSANTKASAALEVAQQNGSQTEVEDGPGTSNVSATSIASSAIDDRLLHSEAQCERLKHQLNELQDVRMQFETEKEEKLLLQTALDEERSRHTREHRALSEEVDAFREKLERKQTSYLSLQEEKENLVSQLQAKSSEMSILQETASIELQEEREKLKSEISSLGNALQNAHNLLEKQQASIDTFQKQAELLEEDKSSLMEEIERLKEQLKESEQKVRSDAHAHSEYASRMRALEEQVAACDDRLKKAAMERDDAVTKFEENARASGALLARVDQVEQANDALKRELEEAKELAERRKKVMDKQAVESQENNAKFTERIASLQAEYEATSKHSHQNYEEKIKALEHTCKRQEQELVRMSHADRAKTREVDSIQQQMRDMQATVTSLENSKGWFERALKDAEKAADERKEEYMRGLESAKNEKLADLDQLRSEMILKDTEITSLEMKITEAESESSKRDEVIDKLKQEIKDEVSKQKLVEKKGQSVLKDLKRQLTNERKRNEKLQEKIKELSSNHSNLDELLEIADKDTTGEGSSVSSFNFRDFISPGKNNSLESTSQAGSGGSNAPRNQPPAAVVNVSKAESRDLLSRITSLQQDKWNLEEQVRHLEESAGAMAEELLEKTKLLQQYVQHTRTDHHKIRSANEELGSTRSFGDRMKSIITGQEEADVTNIRELNRKLTRMLEEEMTKNMALKEDLAMMSEQLSNSPSKS